MLGNKVLDSYLQPAVWVNTGVLISGFAKEDILLNCNFKKVRFMTGIQ